MKAIWLAAALCVLFGFTAHGEGLDCSQPQGSRPKPGILAGLADGDMPIEHIVVIMQENHSFDSYFGKLNKTEFYGDALDGITPGLEQVDAHGNHVGFFHAPKACISDTNHQWNAMHLAWDNGKMDGFARVNGKKVMVYYDERDLPFYYSLANDFATADRYFSSVLGGTETNRLYLYAGTSFGRVKNGILPVNPNQYDQATIFDALEAHGITWKMYSPFFGDYLHLFRPLYRYASKHGHIKSVGSFARDLKRGRLPQVAFVQASDFLEDEHPAADVHVGQAWVAHRVRDLMNSRYWKSPALFLTYDEGGADYDHVPPPPACVPDGIPPKLPAGSLPGGFDRYGIRVPFVAVSPWVKRHYVSHQVYDHTSILKFIETKFNLPALSRRDANANDLLDLFDFGNPAFGVPPLPRARVNWWTTLSCVLGAHGD